MTIVGAGGVRFTSLSATVQFKRQYKKLDPGLQAKVDAAIKQLFQDPLPPGLRFEKLNGYSKPDIYSCHADGNYKFSLEMRTGIDANGKRTCEALLRKVGNHNDIDRSP